MFDREKMCACINVCTFVSNKYLCTYKTMLTCYAYILCIPTLQRTHAPITWISLVATAPVAKKKKKYVSFFNFCICTHVENFMLRAFQSTYRNALPLSLVDFWTCVIGDSRFMARTFSYYFPFYVPFLVFENIKERKIHSYYDSLQVAVWRVF